MAGKGGRGVPAGAFPKVSRPGSTKPSYGSVPVGAFRRRINSNLQPMTAAQAERISSGKKNTGALSPMTAAQAQHISAGEKNLRPAPNDRIGKQPRGSLSTVKFGPAAIKRRRYSGRAR